MWPILIAYLDSVRYIAAWCETRQDYRHFRTDRVKELNVLEDKYPERRAMLIRGWEAATANRQQQA
ncbi:MAG: WYL domain-containing protein [Ruegeria sp.]